MNCVDWEERIALRAGGDLATAEAEELDRHLSGCPACRETAESYRRGMQFLREAHGEPVPAAAYTAVRARVLAELRRNRWPVWLRAGAWGLVSAAVVLLAMLFPAQVRMPQRPAERTAPSLSARVQPEKVERPEAAVARLHRPERRRQPRRSSPVYQARAEEPLMIKLVTDNPEVVIYWFAEGKGD